MAKSSSQPQVRKSVFIVGGIAVGVALLALVVPMLMSGGGGTNVAAPSSTPGITRPSANGTDRKPYVLNAGGRDPFKALLAVSSGTQGAPAATPTPAPAAPGAEPTLVEVLSVKDGLATIRIDSDVHENVKSGAQLSGGFVLEAVQGECAFIARSPERFRVCAGERFLK